MYSKRSMLLMGMLLLLFIRADPGCSTPKPLAGTTSISNLAVKQDENGTWMVDFDYFNTGALPASLSVDLLPQYPAPTWQGIPVHLHVNLILAAPWGEHHVSVPYQPPGGRMPHGGSRRETTRVASGKHLDRGTESWTRASAGPASPSIISAGKTAAIPPEKRLANAVALIDSGQSDECA